MAIGEGRALVLDAESGSLGRWGHLSWVGSGIGIVNPKGGQRTLDMLPDAPIGFTGWLDEEGGLLVIGADRSDRISVIDLNVDELVEAVKLEREQDVGLRSMRFFPLHKESLCCLTESAIFALGPDGRLKWLSYHDDLSLSLAGVRGEVIELESFMPDLELSDRKKVLLDTRTGSEIVV
jgi:hypothetical protein